MNILILEFLINVLVLFIAFPIHECAHAWMAEKLGDRTAKNMGRITLNPLVHIDWMGALCMALTGIGWAKPVPVNPYNFKNKRRDMALTALAGPVSNFIMAYIAMIIYKIINYSNLPINKSYILWVLGIIISLNIGLGIFNLIPIPPLDGSKIFLSERTYEKAMQYQQYMFIVLLIIILTKSLDIPISILSNFVYSGLNYASAFIELIFHVSFKG